MSNPKELFVKMSLDVWNTNLKRMTDSFNSMSDEQMMAEIAPGRNQPVYLLGHMATVHDRMLPLLGIGERKLEHYDDRFITSTDKTAGFPPVSELRAAYAAANEALTNHFSNMSADSWFEKHTAVSDDDFAKEPHRNKLNVLNARANHIAYHHGQLALAKK